MCRCSIASHINEPVNQYRDNTSFTDRSVVSRRHDDDDDDDNDDARGDQLLLRLSVRLFVSRRPSIRLSVRLSVVQLVRPVSYLENYARQTFAPLILLPDSDRSAKSSGTMFWFKVKIFQILTRPAVRLGVRLQLL